MITDNRSTVCNTYRAKHKTKHQHNNNINFTTALTEI